MSSVPFLSRLDELACVTGRSQHLTASGVIAGIGNAITLQVWKGRCLWDGRRLDLRIGLAVNLAHKLGHVFVGLIRESRQNHVDLIDGKMKCEHEKNPVIVILNMKNGGCRSLEKRGTAVKNV